MLNFLVHSTIACGKKKKKKWRSRYFLIYISMYIQILEQLSISLSLRSFSNGEVVELFGNKYYLKSKATDLLLLMQCKKLTIAKALER